MVMQRALTPNEVQAYTVLKEVAKVDWEIPTQEQYEDLMSQVMDIYTDTDSYLVDALNWSRVESNTCVGCFSVKIGIQEHFNDLCGVMCAIHFNKKLRILSEGSHAESFSLAAFFYRRRSLKSSNVELD